jgi:hypothetical protein
VYERPVIRERVIPRYTLRYVPREPEPEPPQHRQRRLLLRAPKEVLPLQETLPPPMHASPPAPCCHCPQPITRPPRRHRNVKKSRPSESRRVAKEDLGLGLSWLGNVKCLTEESLAALATLTAAALETEADDRSLEFVCPRGVHRGDRVEVRLPDGAGTMLVRVPKGAVEGDIIEVAL